ncbi:MAG: hypothetical protein ACJAZ1_000094 [Yoonia sp.]|jgi:hypothetical protein
MNPRRRFVQQSPAPPSMSVIANKCQIAGVFLVKGVAVLILYLA